MWSWFPVLRAGHPTALHPTSINNLHALAKAIEAELFGGDEISGMNTPLLSRSWTPLNGPTEKGKFQPAVLWGAIAANADKAGDKKYANLARHIAFSLRAAGIRLRDASDHHHNQLMAAIASKRPVGERFMNIPMEDLHLAFHSVLSELASARDYLAAALAEKLGAPEKIDALNRFSDWMKPLSKAEMRDQPVVKDMLAAYDSGGADPWLFQLTEYRNLFLHRQPIGSSGAARWLRYVERQHNGLTCPLIEMPLGDDDPFAPGGDALTRFVGLYRRMTSLLDLAAKHAAYESTLLQLTAE
jgi:hypothetical protein